MHQDIGIQYMKVCGIIYIKYTVSRKRKETNSIAKLGCLCDMGGINVHFRFRHLLQH